MGQRLCLRDRETPNTSVGQGVIGGGDFIGGLVPDEPENGKSGAGVPIGEPLANKAVNATQIINTNNMEQKTK